MLMLFVDNDIDGIDAVLSHYTDAANAAIQANKKSVTGSETSR